VARDGVTCPSPVNPLTTSDIVLTLSRMATSLLLRTCSPTLTSHGDFVWPRLGPVEAPDWSPTPSCGQGLHGLLWGEGDASLLSTGTDALWQVVEVQTADVVDLQGKVKVPRGDVVFTGPRDEAVNYLLTHGGQGHAVAFARIMVGTYGTATAGDGGTATAGDDGTATAGAHGTATAGAHGTATAGTHGTATAGAYGIVAAGPGGLLVLAFHDTRRRLALAYVGEGGILPCTRYRLISGVFTAV